jgi:putative two-component system response regulator
MSLSKTIIVVDDEKMITTTLSTLIKVVMKHSVKSFNNPADALSSEEMIQKKADLIITDFMMPGMNGLEFLKNAKDISPDSVTILLTGYADKENAIKSINEVGLYYYMEKPWDNDKLVRTIENGLEKKQLLESLQEKFVELDNSNKEIGRLYDMLKQDYMQEVDNVKNLVITLANVIEAKDSYTDNHTRRVGDISRLLGQKLGIVDKAHLDNLEIAGIIHDIGKVGVSEVVLNKPGKLTDEEFEDMKRHPAIGDDICRPLNCLKPCLDAVRHHHEKLNGRGYPDGIKGEEISIDARIITVADIFDALYSDRPYRGKLPMDVVRKIMYEEVDNGNIDGLVVEELFKMIESCELDSIIS